MRDYGKVYSRIWASSDFRSLSEDGRALVMYLLTCEHGTIAGVFRIPDGYACEDLQWGAERVSEGFANLHEKGFATRCEASKWVWVRKFLEWNPPENPNQCKAAAKVALSVPDGCAWKREFMRVCGPTLNLLQPNPFATVQQPLPNQYQEQYQEQKQERGTAPAAPTPAPAPRKASRKTAMPEDFGVSERVRAWAEQRGYGQLDQHLDAFRRKATAKGYAYVDWDAAFMEAIREDWAKLRGRAANGAAPPPDVQTPRGPDPALLKIKADEARAVPPPPDVQARLRELRKPGPLLSVSHGTEGGGHAG